MAIVGVMGSGTHDWADWATPLGVWIAENHHDLLTGGGGGVMTSVARAFCSVPERQGRSIAIVPTEADGAGGFVALQGYPNRHVDLAIRTPLPRREAHWPTEMPTRNDVNILSSDVVIALPGGAGTKDEIRLCQRFRKPLLCFGKRAAFGLLVSSIPITSSLEEVAAFIAEHLAPPPPVLNGESPSRGSPDVSIGNLHGGSRYS